MEGYLHLGVDMLTAVERVDESMGLHKQPPPAAPSAVPDPVRDRVPTASDNDRALRELQQMMGGVKPK